MSGGSYNYLCRHDFGTEELERMASRLEGLAPGSKAAITTRALCKLMEVGDPLREVWRCVEWYDSMDFSLAQVMDEINNYENRVSAREGGKIGREV